MTTAERVFRPRFTLVVCVLLAAAFIGGATFLLVTLSRSPQAHDADRAMIVVVASIALVTTGLLGRPRAVAGPAGLRVRNPIRSHEFAWEQIVTVRLGRSDPWVLLNLADGTTCAVMAIQAADGQRARRDVLWLRERVAAHEGGEPRD